MFEETLFAVCRRGFARIGRGAGTSTAAALFNRGVVRGYTDDLAHGTEDVQRAIQIGAQPAWYGHQQRLLALRTERNQTRFRGETRRLGR